MTDKKTPEVILLADMLAGVAFHRESEDELAKEAAAELRRQHELNAELVAAVEAALSDDQPYIEKCRAAIAKAKEQT